MQLVLILHELATNAEKFGALSDGRGRLDIFWENVEGEPGKVEIVWKESGGPSVSAPQSKGFGLLLIERSKNLPYLGVNLAFEPTGVVCRIRIDADRMNARGALISLPASVIAGSHGWESALSSSSTHLIFCASCSTVKGFGRKFTSGSRTPLRITAFRLKPVV